MSGRLGGSDRWGGPPVPWGTPEAVKVGDGVQTLFGVGMVPGSVVVHRIDGDRAVVLGNRHGRRDWVVLRLHGRRVEVPAGEIDRTWRAVNADGS